MDCKVSKDLYEAVTGKKFSKFLNENGLLIGYIEDTDIYSNAIKISINDFFFKCKEWIYNNFEHLPKPSIYGGWHQIISYKKDGLYIIDILYSDLFTKHSFSANSEQQAVFTACQWILENKVK